MPQHNDLSTSLVALEQDSTLMAVIEMSQSSWLVTGIVPGVGRHPLKKLEPGEEGVLRLLQRWQEEAARAGRTISRIAVAFEAGRDGFWLARWLRTQGVEAHVIHPASIPVSREHRRAKPALGLDPWDGPARHRAAQARFPGLAARRAGSLQHRRGAHARRRTPSVRPASGRAWWASAPVS